jgi:hypothetical protein
MFVETLNNYPHSTQLIPESRGFTFNSKIALGKKERVGLYILFSLRASYFVCLDRAGLFSMSVFVRLDQTNTETLVLFAFPFALSVTMLAIYFEFLLGHCHVVRYRK